MKAFPLLVTTLSCVVLFAQAGGQTAVHEYPRTPVNLRDIRITDSFWAKRLEINRRVTIPYAFKQCEKTGRIDNFAIAAHVKQGEQSGIYPFDDSDVYKIIEGASYSLMTHPDHILETYIDFVISLIAGAQEEDGYLFTVRTNKGKHLVRWAGEQRWARLSGSHELYNLGHLFEAAAAHHQATGKHTLLDIARKSAQLLLAEFNQTKRQSPPGHQEVEIGLTKLYNVTGEDHYLALARFFLDQRGRPNNGRILWGTYSQDHKPVLEQDEAVGHAVRLVYMLSGMTDIAALQHDSAFATAVQTLWWSIVGRKMYLTGGLGAQGMIEGFGPNYDLPNLSAYCETCASIGFVLLNERLFLLHGESMFIDLLERTLYNGFLSGVGRSGDCFFYPNPLASRGQARSAWFDCACCPSNITRFVPQIPSLVYATRENEVFVNLFVAGKATLRTSKGPMGLRQETQYPWDGRVAIVVESSPDTSMTIHVRVPGWTLGMPVPGNLYRYADNSGAKPTLTVNGTQVSLTTRQGYVALSRRWKPGDKIRLTLPMPIRRVLAHDSVDANRGRVALERGPIVYCTEWMDQPDSSVFNIVLPDTVRLGTGTRRDTLGDVVVLKGRGRGSRVAAGAEGATAYMKEVTAIPYFSWAYRPPGDMTVWLARDSANARALGSSLLSMASAVRSSGGTNIPALHDNAVPEDVSRTSPAYFLSNVADTVWVEYAFRSPQEISGVEVYWVDDGATVSSPSSWRVLLRYDGKWRAAHSPDNTWGMEKNRFNKVVFEAFKTDTLRLEAVLRSRKPVGIAEWKVF